MENSPLHRKIIGQKIRYGGNVANSIVKVITESEYKNGTENILLIKSKNGCQLILDSLSSNNLVIKSLCNTLIKSDIGLIDEFYSEISMEKGACVELLFIDNNWYVLSSDGLKMS